MKKSIRYFTFLALIAGLLFTSCVSNKKFTASEAQNDKLQNEHANTLSKLNECNMLGLKSQEEIEALQKQNEEVMKDYSGVKNDLMVLSAQSNMTIREQAIRLKNLQDKMKAQTEKTNELKNSISKAMMNYKTDELNVYQKDGKVYVSLAEKLLFKSGSDVVDPKGKAALKTLATVLNSSKDFTVAIEGHTDDVPIKTKMFEDNWDLSTARASSIVRVLTNDNGFDSGRITASGRSEFHPVGVNTTTEGRAR
jgi:chemotaxis protein MotB